MKHFIAAATASVVAVSVATAQSDDSDLRGVQAKPSVVSRTYTKPRRHVVYRRHFVPTGTPTPAQVPSIIAYEAARSGVSYSHLKSRVWCESKFIWNAPNGKYNGLGQFASSTFDRGVSTLGSRLVNFKFTKRVVRHVSRHITMSDGTIKTRKAWRVGQFVTVIRRGHLPRNPPYLHGWTQVRIMAQAMAGRSAVHDSEWDCR